MCSSGELYVEMFSAFSVSVCSLPLWAPRASVRAQVPLLAADAAVGRVWPRGCVRAAVQLSLRERDDGGLFVRRGHGLYERVLHLAHESALAQRVRHRQVRRTDSARRRLLQWVGHALAHLVGQQRHHRCALRFPAASLSPHILLSFTFSQFLCTSINTPKCCSYGASLRMIIWYYDNTIVFNKFNYLLSQLFLFINVF